MNKFLASVTALLVLAVGGLYLRKPAPAPVVVDNTEQKAGAAAGPNHYTQESFYNGVIASKFADMTSVNASTTSSTAPTLLLGAGAMGEITVGTSTPAFRIQNASTTAVSSLNSEVWVQQIDTTSMAGVTCNSTQATSTLVSTLFASSTNTSLNGFRITLGSIPATNPACFRYWVVDRSRSGY